MVTDSDELCPITVRKHKLSGYFLCNFVSQINICTKVQGIHSIDIYINTCRRIVRIRNGNTKWKWFVLPVGNVSVYVDSETAVGISVTCFGSKNFLIENFAEEGIGVVIDDVAELGRS